MFYFQSSIIYVFIEKSEAINIPEGQKSKQANGKKKTRKTRKKCGFFK
jgi:hypothetical protein